MSAVLSWGNEGVGKRSRQVAIEESGLSIASHEDDDSKVDVV